MNKKQSKIRNLDLHLRMLESITGAKWEAEERFDDRKEDEYMDMFTTPKKKNKIMGFTADIICRDLKIIIEQNGGLFLKKGGHSTGLGISKDYKKSNLANYLGYYYFQFTPREIDDNSYLELIEKTTKKLKI